MGVPVLARPNGPAAPPVVHAWFTSGIRLEAGDLTPSAASNPEARRVDDEPAVLRTPATPNVHLGHAEVPAQLRRNIGRRAHPASRAAGNSGLARRAGRKSP